MDLILDQLRLHEMHRDVQRNIVSLGPSQDLFYCFADEPEERRLAQELENRVKPPPYESLLPVIHRPFEDAIWFNAIEWPFKHWQASRFSDGSHGVWYGSDSVETTVYESAFHWYHGLIVDAGFEAETVYAERKVYSVHCSTALIDFRSASRQHPDLLHPSDYSSAQVMGARIHREGYPGLLIQSVRRPEGENVAIFTPGVLSRPRQTCQISYRLEGPRIVVEKAPGISWITIDIARFG